MNKHSIVLDTKVNFRSHLKRLFMNLLIFLSLEFEIKSFSSETQVY